MMRPFLICLFFSLLSTLLAQYSANSGLLDSFDLSENYIAPDVGDTVDEQYWATPGELPDDLVYVERRSGTYRSGRKRQGTGNGLESRYVCRPSREDVVRLLLALHDAREGNSARTISFCNLRRPASNVLTNLRFVGRKRR